MKRLPFDGHLSRRMSLRIDVQGVSDERMTDMLHMDADLVRTACHRFHPDDCCIREPLDDLIIGRRRRTVWSNDSFMRIDRIPADWTFYGAAVLLNLSVDDGDITLLHLSLLELLAHELMRIAVLRYCDDAGGVLVKPVNRPESKPFAAFLPVMHDAVRERIHVMACRRVNDQPPRLVHDEDMLILADDLNVHRLG